MRFADPPSCAPFPLRRRACFVTRLTARALLWQALGALPYTVALDHGAGAVVVAVRGTISVNDVVTDFLATPEALDGWLPAGFLQVRRVYCTTDVEAVAWHCVWMSALVIYCCVAAGWCDCLYAHLLYSSCQCCYHYAGAPRHRPVLCTLGHAGGGAGGVD